MAAIILPGRSTRQPTSPATIAAEFLQFNPLRLFNFGVSDQDLITGEFATRNGPGAFTKTPTTKGLGLTFGAANGSDYISFAPRGETLAAANNEVSFVWVGVSAAGVILRDWTVSSGWLPVWNNSNAYDLRLAAMDFTAAGSWVAADAQSIAITTRSTGHTGLYANGRGIIETTNGGYSANPDSPWVLHRNGSEATGQRSTTVALAIFGRAIPPALAREVSASPWILFRKSPRILYFNTSGGGASISGALESISLATFGATVGSARDVAAALESLALTTSAATVSSDRAITASVESISITTSPARIASDRAVAAATEQLTVTPATASVALVSGIAAGTEALSVTANPATVALAASIAATLEAITVTGLTATVSTSSNTNISAALESITVTVNPATVSRDSALAAALESLTVTPHAASIAVGQIVAAALESLTLTSYPAGIALDVAVAAQIEQINLATFAAQVGLGTNVAALTEALTLTPHGATLTFTSNIGAATEHLTLTTFAAVVGATEAALLSPGLEFTIPLSRLGYTIPLSRVHFTIPQE